MSAVGATHLASLRIAQTVDSDVRAFLRNRVRCDCSTPVLAHFRSDGQVIDLLNRYCFAFDDLAASTSILIDAVRCSSSWKLHPTLSA